jgi:hypothetical protein
MGHSETSLDRVGRFISSVGAPTAIALALLWGLLTQFPRVTEALTNLNATIGQVGMTLASINRDLSEHRGRTEVELRATKEAP